MDDFISFLTMEDIWGLQMLVGRRFQGLTLRHEVVIFFGIDINLRKSTLQYVGDLLFLLFVFLDPLEAWVCYFIELDFAYYSLYNTKDELAALFLMIDD